GHGSQRDLAETRYLGERDDRRSQRAISDWRSIGDQRQPRCLERPEAKTDQQCSGDRDRSAESGGAFEEGSKAEGDQQQLQAAVLRDAGQAMLQNIETTAIDRELI